ncbi:hypothetical protein GOP47_0002146 [Adiantum capillus-veneris]|uniref:Uncharacterized protein n=1 Tax=Adiantum capillus-veneris TaxID=13818 RepID=A0A9D4ZNS9_ADICA|nr:hypothetical protein GOP47_0002146 [Adiantum capillus-veneris]
MQRMVKCTWLSLLEPSKRPSVLRYPAPQVVQPSMQLLGFAHQRPPDLQNLPTVLLRSFSRALSSRPSSPALDHGKVPKLHPFGQPPLLSGKWRLRGLPQRFVSWILQSTGQPPFASRAPLNDELPCSLMHCQDGAPLVCEAALASRPLPRAMMLLFTAQSHPSLGRPTLQQLQRSAPSPLRSPCP